MFSPQEKIVEFIKMTPFKSLHTLDTVLLPEWYTAVCLCLVIVVHESLVCPEQLNCLLFFSCSTNSLVFQHFCVFEPFPTMTVWFWDPSFHTEDDWETHYNYYRRFKHSPMLQKKKPCIKSSQWGHKYMNNIFKTDLSHFTNILPLH